MNWIYTSIQHGPRIELGISPNEYCVLDVYYQTQASPKYSVDGWSENSYKQISDFLGFSKGAVHAMVDRFVTAGLMEVNPANPKQKKTTEAWYSTAYDRVQKMNGNKPAVQKMNGAVQKMNASRSKIERHIEEIEVKRELKENELNQIALEIYSSVNRNPVQTKPVASAVSLEEKYPDPADKAEAIYKKCIETLKVNSMLFPVVIKQANINITKDQFAGELRKWVEYYIHDSKFFQDAHKRINYGRGSFKSWLSSDKTRDQYAKLNAATVSKVLKGKSPFEQLRELRAKKTA
jgi:hypothetical protein